ncbi:hypothetical protein EKL85_21520 [Salmonella enterica subsp. enterica serovar Give]|nr:hypothetical protein [Salmonella enterica subsp. enterica serovar Give]ECA4141861.1 hypothetical protein [Salmonella enterica subsp. enterica serovar Give]
MNIIYGKAAFLAVSSLLLTGCDQAKDLFNNEMNKMQDERHFAKPVIVFAPGWQMNDHGKKAAVYGQSNCPDVNGHPTTEEGCIIIDRQTTTVAVSVTDLSSRPVRTEIWTIERKGDSPENSVHLKRPDNSYVLPWRGHNSNRQENRKDG